jgi:3-phenylpropionate/trans-cinnamate dioxygenase ferredoxin reductase subunit
MQYIGHATRWDEIAFRGDVAGRSFTAFFVEGGRLSAALAVNKQRDIRACRELIKRDAPVSAEALRDESRELNSLIPQTV